MKAVTAQALAAAIEARRAVVLLRDLASGEDQLFFAPTDDPDVQAVFQSGKAQSFEREGGSLFLQPYLPGQRLFIVGGVHIAQPLVTMAQALDHEVKIIDPRGLYANAARFPTAELLLEWPEEAFARLGLDESTAVVCLSHDPKLDDPALMAALCASRRPSYIGGLGSRRTHGKRVERLAQAGFSPEQIAEISAPIGLSIGAVTPAEIAVSIAAELIARVRQR